MVSKEDICNGALAFVDSPNRMRSFIDPDSSGDYACVEFYDLARRKLLSLHTWAFATVTERMSPVDMAKVPENQHPRDQRDRFLVHPEGTMMVSKVMDQSGDRVNYNLVSVQVEGKWTTVVRTSDRDPLWIERVFDQEETGQFDHNFVPLLQVLLASYISVPLDASQSLRDRLASTYRMYLSEAQGKDSRESQEPEPRAPWLSARQYYGYR